MEKTSTLGKGDKVQLKVLLEPLLKMGNEIICVYRSDDELREFCFRMEDLVETHNDKLRMIKPLTIEDTHNRLIMCRMAGYRQKFTFHFMSLKCWK